MKQPDDRTTKWARYFENQKKFWCDSSTSLVVKGIIRLVEIHRSDSKGWSLSVRRIAHLLRLSPNTVMLAINTALTRGWLETNKYEQRKRRKLRLSALLRAPVEHETTGYSHLSQWEEQPDSPSQSEIVSPSETVNTQGNNQANSEESQIKEAGETESLSPKGQEFFRKFREEGPWTKKF